MESRKYRDEQCENCKIVFKTNGNSVKYCSRKCCGIKYRELNRERLNANSLITAQKFHKEKREYLRAIKLSCGCKDCGYKGHPAALDFDHVRGEKVCDVSHCTTREKLINEVAKCEVVCANCHRIRTYNRRENKKAGREVIVNVMGSYVSLVKVNSIQSSDKVNVVIKENNVVI